MPISVGEFLQDVRYGILNFILYIPRKIYRHFKYIKDLEKKFKEAENQIHERDLMFKRIKEKSEYYKTSNQLLSYVGFCQIKELAQTFPQEQD